MKEQTETKMWFARGSQSDLGSQSGKVAEAEENSIQCNESFTDAHVNLGFVCLQTGDYEEALRCFRKVIEMEPKNPEAYNNLGFVYEKMERYGSAKQMYKRAFELHPGDIEALINLGHIAELEGDYYGAVENYKEACIQNMQAVSPHFCLAELYDHYDMFEEALREYAIVLERDPGHVKAAFNMGILCGQIGDYMTAVSMFERVLESKPNLTEARNNLASIYESMGLSEEAEQEYRQSLNLDPMQEEPNIRLARIQYLKSRSYPYRSQREEALRRLYFVLGINPQNKKAKKLLKEMIGPSDEYTCRRDKKIAGAV